MNYLAAEKSLVAWGFGPTNEDHVFQKTTTDRIVYVYFSRLEVTAWPRYRYLSVRVRFTSLEELELAVVYQTLRELPR